MADDLVRRFAISFPMMRTYTDPNGPFVLYSDYAALRAQLDEALADRSAAYAALKPFADVADDFDADGRDLADTDGVYANVAGDFRRARAIRQRGESE